MYQIQKKNHILNEAPPPPLYTKALKMDTTNLKFDVTCTNNNNEKNKTRKRKITWFNLAFSIDVATNVVKIFLTLIDKTFPRKKV